MGRGRACWCMLNQSLGVSNIQTDPTVSSAFSKNGVYSSFSGYIPPIGSECPLLEREQYVCYFPTGEQSWL